MTQRTLHSLWQRGCDFLGCDYAIIGGAMTWVSERNLVSAISNAGGFGVLACGAMPPALLEAEIKATQALTKKPFGVNLIVMHPQLDELIEICIKTHVSHVVLAGGIPGKKTLSTLTDAGIKVLCFAPSAIIGRKLIKMGAGALIIEGSEAGGHVGPVSTSVLAQEILPEIKEVPVFVGGGIGRGEAIASYLEMGASGCQMGTLFVCSEESVAHINFKNAFIRASARDAQLSVQLDPLFPVIPVRALTNDASKKFLETQRKVIERFNRGETTQKEAQLEIEHFWAGALRRAVVEGDIEGGSLMAGQSVGMVKAIQPVKVIIDSLCHQASLALNREGKDHQSH